MNPSPEKDRALVFAFMETAGEPDLMSTTADLSDWLVRTGLMPTCQDVTDDDLRLARRVRASLFALLVANGGQELDARVPVVLGALSEAAPLEFMVGDGGQLQLVAGGSGVANAMARLMAVVYRATITGEFARWKACRKCAWPFFDTSKNRSRVWCDMQLCGSQEKSKSYRERRSLGQT